MDKVESRIISLARTLGVSTEDVSEIRKRIGTIFLAGPAVSVVGKNMRRSIVEFLKYQQLVSEAKMLGLEIIPMEHPEELKSRIEKIKNGDTE